MMLLNIIVAIIYFNEALCRGRIFDELNLNQDHSEDYGSDAEELDEDEAYESGLVDDQLYNISAEDHYAEAVREAMEILGEHKEIITRLKTPLGLLDSKENQGHQKLRKYFQTVEDLIDKNSEALREKFFSEIFYKDMIEPIDKSTVDSLSALRKESKLALDNLQLNEETKKLKKWLEDTNHKILAQFGVLESLMTQVNTMLSDIHNHKQK